MTATRRLLPLVLASALLAACGSDAHTGIVAEVTSDLQIPGELDEVRVVATSGAGAPLYERSFPLSVTNPHPLPLRVGFEPARDGTTPFRIEAIGLRAGRNVVSRSATLTFVKGKVIVLPLPLLAVCNGVACADAAQTCKASGACEPDVVDPGTLPSYRPGADASIPPEGGAAGSAGSDAGRDAAAGSDAPTGDAPAADTISSDAPVADAPPGDTPAADKPGDAPADAPASDARDATVSDLPREFPSVIPSLNTGLVGYWSFDTDVTVFPDHSGNHNDIVLGPGMSLWTDAGAYGGGIALTNGRSAGAAATTSVNSITKAITIAAYTLAPSNGTVRAVVSRYLGPDYWKLGFADNGRLRFTVGPQIVSSPMAADAVGGFAHIAATYDGKTARLYVKGVQVATAEVGAISLAGGPAAGGPGGYGILFGGTFMDVTGAMIEPYGGLADEITIYNRALDPDEIAALAAGVFPQRATP